MGFTLKSILSFLGNLWSYGIMKGTSYDDVVDKWLKGNAKKYGYKYTKQK